MQLAPGLFKPKPQEVIDFSRQLASLLNSGISLTRGLAAQRDQARSAGLREALSRILKDIEGGQRVSDAFSRHTSVFPELYLRLLAVGEATGSIAPTLEQVTDNMQRRQEVASRVKRALVYPAISLGVALGAGFVLVTFSLPSLTSLLEGFGGELPFTTKLLLSLSDVLSVYAPFIMGLLVALVIAVPVSLKTEAGRHFKDGFLLKIPYIRNVLIGSNMFFLTTTLSTLLRGGIAPIEAMKLSENGLGNVVIRERLARVTQRASEGTRLGEAFEEERGFPPILAQAVVTGELQGSIADNLAGLADYYEDVTERSVSGATELIQPAIILVVATLVGFVAVAVVSGIYSTLGSVG